MAHSSLKIIPFANKDNLITAFKVKKTIITNIKSTATESFPDTNQKSFIFADLENKFDPYQCLTNEFDRVSESLKIHDGLYEFKLMYPISLDMFSLFLVHANLKVFKLSKDITGKIINYIVVSSQDTDEFMTINDDEEKLFNQYINRMIKLMRTQIEGEDSNEPEPTPNNEDGGNEDGEEDNKEPSLDLSMEDAHSKGYSLQEAADGEIKLKIEFPSPEEEAKTTETVATEETPETTETTETTEEANTPPSPPPQVDTYTTISDEFGPSLSSIIPSDALNKEEPPLTSQDMELIGEILNSFIEQLLTSQKSNLDLNIAPKSCVIYIPRDATFNKDEPIESICSSPFSRYVKHVSPNRRVPQPIIYPTSAPSNTPTTLMASTSTSDEDEEED